MNGEEIVLTDAEQSGIAELRVCDRSHGAPHNAASVYGHHGSVRACIRLHGTDTWVYDPRWERR